MNLRKNLDTTNTIPFKKISPRIIYLLQLLTMILTNEESLAYLGIFHLNIKIKLSCIRNCFAISCKIL